MWQLSSICNTCELNILTKWASYRETKGSPGLGPFSVTNNLVSHQEDFIYKISFSLSYFKSFLIYSAFCLKVDSLDAGFTVQKIDSHFSVKPNLGYVRFNWGWVGVLTINLQYDKNSFICGEKFFSVFYFRIPWIFN